MGEIDAGWFKERMAAKGLTQGEFGKRIGMDPSSTSLMFQGRRAVTIERAADMARVLGATLEEVCQRAGVKMAALGDRIRIDGYINGGAEVVRPEAPIGWTVSPGKLPPDTRALVLRTTQTELDMLNGWVAFVGPADERVSESIDRTVIAKLKNDGRELMRLIRRGSGSAQYTLTGLGHEPVHDVEIESVRPVLAIRPV